jgi:hypothetical protein
MRHPRRTVSRMHRSIALLVVATLLAACGPSAPSPSVPSSSPAVAAATSPPPTAARSAGQPNPSPTGTHLAWEVLDDAPFARLEMATAAHDGRIWLAGGLSSVGDPLTEVSVFDPATGEWSEGPSLPTALHHAALVSDGERLILIGGYIGADFTRPTEIVLLLEDGADAWTEGRPLPEPRAAGAAAFDGKSTVYYAGGVSVDGVNADIFGLDDAGEWRLIGDMNGPVEHLAATSDGNGTVFFLGGRVGGLDATVTDVWLLTEDFLTRIIDLPTRRGGAAAFFSLDHGACLTGGEATDRAFTEVECLAPSDSIDGGTLTTLPPLNEPHHGHGAAVVDGVAYVLLGGTEPGLSAGSTIEALRLEP